MQEKLHPFALTRSILKIDFLSVRCKRCLASHLLTPIKIFFRDPKKVLTRFSNGVLNKVQHSHVGAHARGYGDSADTSF